MKHKWSHVVVALVTGALVLTGAPATAARVVAVDTFYTYDGERPLSSYPPGEVLKTRTVQYHIAGIPLPLRAVQLLYRTTDAQGRPSANVTSVVRSSRGDRTKALSYQSFYDSLSAEHGPSRAIAGDVSLGGLPANVESLLLAPALDLGYDIILPDTEGQEAHFAAGPEYGTTTLDSIRAATRAPETGLRTDTRVGLVGYSGGSIATNWAAALAPSYAPEVNRRLVGFAEGGVLVAPAHNLRYVGGSLLWSGVAAMAIVGAARAYDIDMSPYTNQYGARVLREMEHASIVDVLGRYPGLTWAKLMRPEYSDPNSVLPFVEAANRINLGSAPTPTIPAYIVQGDNGLLQGTINNLPGIGTGDGVMVSGDVRALARQYCATGSPAVKYEQHALLGHVGAAIVWAPAALTWLNDRFAGRPAPSSCGRIPAGNSLAPEQPTTR